MRTSNFGAEAEAEHSYFLLRSEPENFLINLFLFVRCPVRLQFYIYRIFILYFLQKEGGKIVVLN